MGQRWDEPSAPECGQCIVAAKWFVVPQGCVSRRRCAATMADPPDVDEAPLPLPGAAVEAEPGRTAERRVCGRCRYSVPLSKWPRHEEHCAAFFVRPSAAEQLVQRHGALPFLRRFLRVWPLRRK